MPPISIREKGITIKKIMNENSTRSYLWRSIPTEWLWVLIPPSGQWMIKH
jgi:hypothetical protein